MKELTEEQKTEYIKGHGDCCPYCHSRNITDDGDFISYGNKQVERITHCWACDEEWREVYALAAVFGI